MTHYHQMRAACGLASALMVLRPRSDGTVREILDKASADVQRDCQGLKSMLDSENTRHQVAAAFILLKTAISDLVQEMLAQHDPAAYEDIQAVILYEMRTRLRVKRTGSAANQGIVDEYVDTGKITGQLLQSYAMIVKSNVELKLLLAMFGYQFVPFPGSTDGTGALSLGHGPKRGKVVEPSTRKSYAYTSPSLAIAFLIQNFDDCGILVCRNAHWSAIKAMAIADNRLEALYYLDPGSTTNKEFTLNMNDPSSRLYCFRKNAGLLEKSRHTLHDLL